MYFTIKKDIVGLMGSIQWSISMAFVQPLLQYGGFFGGVDIAFWSKVFYFSCLQCKQDWLSVYLFDLSLSCYF